MKLEDIYEFEMKIEDGVFGGIFYVRPYLTVKNVPAQWKHTVYDYNVNIKTDIVCVADQLSTKTTIGNFTHKHDLTDYIKQKVVKLERRIRPFEEHQACPNGKQSKCRQLSVYNVNKQGVPYFFLQYAAECPLVNKSTLRFIRKAFPQVRFEGMSGSYDPHSTVTPALDQLPSLMLTMDMGGCALPKELSVEFPDFSLQSFSQSIYHQDLHAILVPRDTSVPRFEIACKAIKNTLRMEAMVNDELPNRFYQMQTASLLPSKLSRLFELRQFDDLSFTVMYDCYSRSKAVTKMAPCNSLTWRDVSGSLYFRNTSIPPSLPNVTIFIKRFYNGKRVLESKFQTMKLVINGWDGSKWLHKNELTRSLIGLRFRCLMGDAQLETQGVYKFVPRHFDIDHFPRLVRAYQLQGNMPVVEGVPLLTTAYDLSYLTVQMLTEQQILVFDAKINVDLWIRDLSNQSGTKAKMETIKEYLAQHSTLCLSSNTKCCYFKLGVCLRSGLVLFFKFGSMLLMGNESALKRFFSWNEQCLLLQRTAYATDLKVIVRS